MKPFSSLTSTEVANLPPSLRHAYERWFWEWMLGDRQAETEADIATERKEGYSYDRKGINS